MKEERQSDERQVDGVITGNRRHSTCARVRVWSNKENTVAEGKRRIRRGISMGVGEGTYGTRTSLMSD